MKLLCPQLLKVDLLKSVPEIGILVFFIEGRHDHESPCEIAEKYSDGIVAPSRELIWFDRPTNLPNSEERDLFNKIMVEKILPIAAHTG